MLRLLRALRRGHNRDESGPVTTPSRPLEGVSSLTITEDMAEKLFGPELTPVPRSLEPSRRAEAEPEAVSRYVPYRAPKPPPRPGSFEEVKTAADTEPRFRALLGASTGEERRELAKAIPEISPPYPFLSKLGNEVLELIYLGGGAYTEVGRQYGLSANKAKQMARVALCYVAFYKKQPERSDERIQKCFDPGFQQFMMARSVEEKRFAAKRHPEIKMMLKKLTDREAQVIQALYWEDQTLVEADERFGVSRDRVRQIANKGLRKLRYHDSWEWQRYKDRERRDDILHALQLPTLSEAARALELSPNELLACLNRLEIAPSVASPDRVAQDDPRVEALKAAKSPRKKQKVAMSYPELRPSHVFLSANENKVLECRYWQGMSREDVAKELYWASVTRVKELEASALEKLLHYLRHQPLSYYQVWDLEKINPTLLYASRGAGIF